MIILNKATPPRCILPAQIRFLPHQKKANYIAGFLLIEQLVVISIFSLFITFYIKGFTHFEKYSLQNSFSWNAYFLTHLSRFSAIAKDDDSLIKKEGNHLIIKENKIESYSLPIPTHLNLLINNKGTLGFKGSGNTKHAGKIIITSSLNKKNIIKIGIWDGPITHDYTDK